MKAFDRYKILREPRFLKAIGLIVLVMFIISLGFYEYTYDNSDRLDVKRLIVEEDDVDNLFWESDIDDIKFFDKDGGIIDHHVVSFDPEKRKAEFYIRPRAGQDLLEASMDYGDGERVFIEDIGYEEVKGVSEIFGDGWSSSSDSFDPLWGVYKPVGGHSVFDGSGDYILSGNADDLKLVNGTMEAWIKTPNAGSSYRGLIVKSGAYGLFLTNNILSIYDWSTSTLKSTNVNLADNNWHHIAIAFQEPGEDIIYIDGKANLTTSFSNNHQSYPFSIGNNYNTQYFTGSIDEVRLYNRILSETEINQSYQRGLIGLKSNITSNLVGYWDFENEGTVQGSEWDDKSGGSNDGTAYGDVYANEHIGGFGVFDGTGDKILVSDDPSLDFTDKITVAMWIKTNTNTKGFLAKPTNTNGNYALKTTSTGKLRFTLIGGSQVNVDSSTTISDGEWHFVVGTYDKSLSTNRVKVYVDGSLEGTNGFSNSISTNNDNLIIGGYYSDSYLFNGKMDEVQLFDRALTSDEISQIYQRGLLGLRSNITDNLVAYWPMDSDFDDYSGNNDGTGYGDVFYTNITFFGGSDILSFNRSLGTTLYPKIELYNDHGSLKFSTGLNDEDQDFRSYVDIGDSFVALDPDKFDSSLNNVTNVSLKVDNCNKDIYYLNVESSNLSQIVSQGQVCDENTEPSCTNIVCSNNVFNFTVEHFDSYGLDDENSDNVSPSVGSLSDLPDPAGYGVNVTISANVTDESGINNVLVQITKPDNSKANYTMDNISSIYSYKFSSYDNGTYDYIIYANDVNGNLNGSETGSFDIYNNISSFINTLNDTYLLGEFVNITGSPEYENILSYQNYSYQNVKDVFIYDLTDDSIDYTTWYNDSSKSWWQEANETIVDNAIYLDGSGDSIETAGVDDFSFGTGNFTIQFWMNHDLSSYTSNAIMTSNINGSQWNDVDDQFLIYMPSTNVVRLLNWDGSGTTLVSMSSAKNKWNKMTFVRRGDTIFGYKNGVYTGQSNNFAGKEFNIQKFGFGRQDTRNNYYYKGYLDEVTIFDRALTNDEILSSYERELDHLSNNITDGLVGYWDFEDYGCGIKSDCYIDESSNSNDGTGYGDTRISGRSSKTNFPTKSYIVLTETGIDILDAENESNVNTWMSFQRVGTDYTDRGYIPTTDYGLPSDFVIKDGAINFIPDGTNGELATVSFIDDGFITRIQSGEFNLNNNPTISQRHIENGVNLADLGGGRLPSRTVFDVDMVTIDGVHYVAVATSVGPSILNFTTLDNFRSADDFVPSVAEVYLENSTLYFSNTNNLFKKTGIDSINYVSGNPQDWGTYDDFLALANIKTITSDDTYLYTGKSTGVQKINKSDLTLDSTIFSGDVVSLSISEDKSMLYVADNGSGVYEINLSDNTIVNNWTSELLSLDISSIYSDVPTNFNDTSYDRSLLIGTVDGVGVISSKDIGLTDYYSYIKNFGETDIIAYLKLAVQYFNTTLSDWVTDTIVWNDTMPRSIGSGETLYLDEFWNNFTDGVNGWNSSDKIEGTYRAYAELAGSDGELLYNYDGVGMNASDNFTIEDETVDIILNSTTIYNFTTDNLTLNVFVNRSGKDIVLWYKNNESYALLDMPFECTSNSSFTQDYSGSSNASVYGAYFNSSGGHDSYGAYEFEGVNSSSPDRIVISGNISEGGLDLNQSSGSFAAWIRPLEFPGDDSYNKQILAPSGENNKGIEIALGSDCGSDVSLFFTGERNNDWNTYSAVDLSGDISRGEWLHLVVAWDWNNDKDVKFYINGEERSPCSSSISRWDEIMPAPDNWTIGADINITSRTFNGSIDDVKMFDHQISSEQARILYEGEQVISSDETETGDVWYAELLTINCTNSNDNLVSNEVLVNGAELDVTLISPEDGYKTNLTQVNFSCSAVDYYGLENISLWTNISGTWEINDTKDVSGLSNSSTFIVDGIEVGNYSWNCQAFSLNGSYRFAEENFSFEILYLPNTYLVVNTTPQENMIYDDKYLEFRAYYIIRETGEYIDNIDGGLTISLENGDYVDMFYVGPYWVYALADGFDAPGKKEFSISATSVPDYDNILYSGELNVKDKGTIPEFSTIGMVISILVLIGSMLVIVRKNKL